MPASMMSAPSTGIEYVTGSRRLMVASGPSPGSRPTSVPTTQPTAQNMRFCSVSACSNPKARFWRMSISVERQLEAEAFLKQQRNRDQPAGNLDVAHHRVRRSRSGGHEHQEHDPGD